MRIDPKRVMQDHLKAIEKYEAYKQECKAKGEEPLPFPIWEKIMIDKAWEEAFSSDAYMLIDLGRTKIVVWPPENLKETEKC